MKKNNDKFILTILVTAAITIVLLCIIVTVVPHAKPSKATKYDLNCVTRIGGNPLKDCRVESDKCLIEVDGAPNTYELRPWEDCEE